MPATIVTAQNPDGPKVLKFVDNSGLSPTVYVGVGYQNTVTVADGTSWTLSLVDVVPQGGGPGNPLPPV